MNLPVDLSDRADVALDHKSELGEGPIWHERTSTLVFVDSLMGNVHRFDPVTKALTTREVGQDVGAAIPRRGGGFVATTGDGLLAVSETGGRPELLVPIEQHLPDNRMNDAKCDSRGRLWSGTFSMKFERKAGALYRIDPDLRLTQVVEGVSISNGIAWSPDERRMYYADTATRGVDVFDYDIETGLITNRRRFVDIERKDGLPDGMTVDAEGCLWVALYLGGAVRRYSPEGEWIATITLPLARVTSCNFGGPALDDLYITTANHLVRDDGRPHEPLAGALFRCRPGVSGPPSYEFAG